MLYDPKWEKQAETKADPFTLGSLIAWLETKPAHNGYSYGCTGHCLLAQYFTAMGYRRVNMGPDVFYHGSSNDPVMVPVSFNDVAINRYGRLHGGKPEYTFGAALERARNLQNAS